MATNGSARRTAVSNSADVEADGAVTQHREDRRLGLDQTRRERERQRAADGAGDAVDEAPAHRKHALTPLGKFAAIADQDSIRIAFDEGPQGTKHFRRMQPARCARCDGAPCCRTRVERLPRLDEPSGVARAALAWRRRVFRAASAGSATPVKTSASPFSRRSRAISSASGSTAITWTAGWKLGCAHPPGVKSSALPSSTTRSARVRQIAERPERSRPQARADSPE